MQRLVTHGAGTTILWACSPWRPTLVISKRHFDDLFSFGSTILAIKFLEFSNRNADNILIGYFLGPTALGYYTIAYRFFKISRDLLTGITSPVAVSAFSSIQSDIPRLRKAFYLVTRITSVVSFPIFIGIFILAPEIVTTLFGERWEPSIAVLRVLALVGLIESVYQFNSNVMIATGNPMWKLKLVILSALLNIIGFAISVHWGIVAVASAYTIRAYLVSPLPLLVLKKLISVDIGYYLKNMMGGFVAAIAMAIIVWKFKGVALYLELNGLTELLFLSLVGAIAYLILLLCIDFKIVGELRNLLGGLRNKR